MVHLTCSSQGGHENQSTGKWPIILDSHGLTPYGLCPETHSFNYLCISHKQLCWTPGRTGSETGAERWRVEITDKNPLTQSSVGELTCQEAAAQHLLFQQFVCCMEEDGSIHPHRRTRRLVSQRHYTSTAHKQKISIVVTIGFYLPPILLSCLGDQSSQTVRQEVPPLPHYPGTP